MHRRYEFLYTTQSELSPRRVWNEGVLDPEITPYTIGHFRIADYLLFIQDNVSAELLTLKVPSLFFYWDKQLLLLIKRNNFGVLVSGGINIGTYGYKKHYKYYDYRQKRHKIEFIHQEYLVFADDPAGRRYNREVKRIIAKKRRHISREMIRKELEALKDLA